MNIFIKKFLVSLTVFLGLVLLGLSAFYFTRELPESSVSVNIRMEQTPQIMVEMYHTQPMRYLMFWRIGDDQPLWVLDSNERDAVPRPSRLYPAMFWGEVPTYMTQVFPTNNSRPRPLRVGETLVALVGFYYMEDGELRKGEYIRTYRIEGPEEISVVRTWHHTNSGTSTVDRPENLTPEVERVLGQ